MRESVLRFSLPIYDALICVVVSDSTMHSVNKRKDELHAYADVESSGCVFYDGNRFYCFLRLEDLDMNVLAHEIFHMTHRISDWAVLNFDQSHHEATAQIHGYLFSRIFSWLQRKSLACF